MKCKNCRNLNGIYISYQKKSMDWCDYIVDSPDTECERECDFFEPETNADRIRNMSDEELAEHFSDLIKDTQEHEYCEDVSDWLIWLQKEVE